MQLWDLESQERAAKYTGHPVSPAAGRPLALQNLERKAVVGPVLTAGMVRTARRVGPALRPPPPSAHSNAARLLSTHASATSSPQPLPSPPLTHLIFPPSAQHVPHHL